MSDIFLKQKHVDIIFKIFSQYCPNAEIWAYGSRLNGNAHSGSDLDLVVKNFNSPSCKLTELKQMLNDSNIPFNIDINEYDLLPNYFQTEIQNNYVVFYEKTHCSINSREI